MLRFGPPDGPVVIAAPALFEEGNRTRAFLVRILRLLGARGVASVLPDLPGQGESMFPIEQVTIMRWMEAFEAACEHTAKTANVVSTVSIRGGTLVDTLALVQARWQLAPIEGEVLLKELWRVRQLGEGRRGEKYDRYRFVGEADVQVAGTTLTGDLRAGLLGASPHLSKDGVPVRVVRLDADPLAADLKLPGRPLWRASEPDVEEALAVALADDIAAWVRTCAA